MIQSRADKRVLREAQAVYFADCEEEEEDVEEKERHFLSPLVHPAAVHRQREGRVNLARLISATRIRHCLPGAAAAAGVSPRDPRSSLGPNHREEGED